MIDQVKAHISRNRERYITGSVVVVAGITCYIVRGRTVAGFAASEVNIRPFAFFSKQNVVTVIEREGRGHPGYLVKCLETGDIFRTQGDAARALGVDGKTMTRHILGDLPHVNDLHFERLSGRI
jgi:hypothetical protein